MDNPTPGGASPLLAEIYQGITEPERWTETLDRLLHRFGASGAIIFSLGPSQIHTTSNFYGSTFSMSDLDQFGSAIATRDRDLVATSLQHGAHRPVTLSEIIPDTAPRPLALEALGRELWGTEDILLTGLRSTGPYWDILALHYRDELAQDAAVRGAGFHALLPHITRALEMTRPFQILRERYKAALEALDHIRLGVFIMDTKGRVVLRNTRAAALLDARDGLTVGSDGKLGPRDETLRESFDRDLAGLWATPFSRTRASGSVQSIPRKEGRPPYIVELSRLHVDGQLEGVLAIVADPSQPDSVSPAGLAAVHGMSESEAQICLELIRGSSNRVIAEKIGRSPETVKSSVARLLRTTGARNRIDLTRLALSAHWPVDDPLAEPDGSTPQAPGQ